MEAGGSVWDRGVCKLVDRAMRARSHTPGKAPTSTHMYYAEAVNSIARKGQGMKSLAGWRGIPWERVPSGDFAEGESDEEC